VRDDGTIAGYAILRRSEALVIVDPDTVDAEVGRTLLEWSERRERELGRSRHRRPVAATDMRGRALSSARRCESRNPAIAPRCSDYSTAGLGMAAWRRAFRSTASSATRDEDP
jgi:hypothetical protein